MTEKLEQMFITICDQVYLELNAIDACGFLDVRVNVMHTRVYEWSSVLWGNMSKGYKKLTQRMMDPVLLYEKQTKINLKKLSSLRDGKVKHLVRYKYNSLRRTPNDIASDYTR